MGRGLGLRLQVAQQAGHRPSEESKGQSWVGDDYVHAACEVSSSSLFWRILIVSWRELATYGQSNASEGVKMMYLETSCQANLLALLLIRTIQIPLHMDKC